MTGRLEGRVALVTGASRGIGAAIAHAYAREGAAVALNHEPTDAMARSADITASQIREYDGTAITVAADVTHTSSVERMVDRTRAELGPVDVLVLNAAFRREGTWTEIPESEWDRVMSVNLKAAWLCSRSVYPDMRARGSGKIIAVSSVMAQLGLPGALHYVASKAGLVGFTRALAREVGPDGIGVNCVMPGAIRTEYEVERHPDAAQLRDTVLERQCLPRRGYPQDVAGTFVFLACSESDFITGQVLNVDGGWALR